MEPTARNRTCDLPGTDRPLCLLSYVGNGGGGRIRNMVAGSRFTRESAGYGPTVGFLHYPAPKVYS